MSEYRIPLPTAGDVLFRNPPRPVPGDLRIPWRLSVVVLILAHCQKNKASLPKLHLLSDALKDEKSMLRLSKILDGNLSALAWKLSVEPALGRALDLARGEGFVTFEKNAAYRLSKKGEVLAKILIDDDGILLDQKVFLLNYAKRVTEKFVDGLVRMQTGGGQ